MENIELISKGDNNLIKIKGTLTSGKILAIIRSLELSPSPVANDVKCFFRNAIYNDCQKNSISRLQDIQKWVNFEVTTKEN